MGGKGWGGVNGGKGGDGWVNKSEDQWMGKNRGSVLVGGQWSGM